LFLLVLKISFINVLKTVHLNSNKCKNDVYSHSILNYTIFTSKKLHNIPTVCPYKKRLDVRHNVLSTVLEVFIIYTLYILIIRAVDTKHVYNVTTSMYIIYVNV